MQITRKSVMNFSNRSFSFLFPERHPSRFSVDAYGEGWCAKAQRTTERDEQSRRGHSLSDQIGSLTAGHAADFALLDADPLANIDNAREYMQ